MFNWKDWILGAPKDGVDFDASDAIVITGANVKEGRATATVAMGSFRFYVDKSNCTVFVPAGVGVTLKFSDGRSRYIC